MLKTSEVIQKYLEDVVAGVQTDALAKGQKIPQYFRIVVTEDGGMLFGADYFKYRVFGRGPGKFPPPDKMLEFVKKNPEVLASARQKFKNISEKSLAFLIGRKIAKKGTDIFLGKKPGVDLLGVMDSNMPEFLHALLRNETLKMVTNLKQNVANR